MFFVAIFSSIFTDQGSPDEIAAMIPALIIPICFLPVFLIIFAARGNRWNSYYRAYKKQQEYFAMHQISLDQLRNIPPGPVKTAFPGNFSCSAEFFLDYSDYLCFCWWVNPKNRFNLLQSMRSTKSERCAFL